MGKHAKALDEERARYALELQKHARLDKASKLLKLPCPSARWRLIHKDKHGYVLSDRKSFSHSWTRNAYNFHTMLASGVDYGSSAYSDGNLKLKRNTGTIYSFLQLYSQNIETAYGYNTTGTSDSASIVIGTGSTAESFDDYDLDTAIDHGTGSGEMEHAASNLVEGWNSGSGYYYSVISRSFTNNSSGSITVNEMGALWRNTNGYAFLMVRDVLSPGEAVADTDHIDVSFEFRLTFP